MSKQKPVWKVNTGNGVPSDLDGVVVDFSGVIYCSLPSKTLMDKKYWNWYYEVSPVIAAYQTTHTKAAKYERVECKNCNGTGEVKSICKCSRCNGKGYRLEAINHAS